MREVKIKLTNDLARRVECYLKTRYNRDGRTSLDNLCKIAILREMVAQAKDELEEANMSL